LGEVALTHLVGAGEVALFVTEELRLHQRLGERSAVGADERLIPARAQGVDRARGQLLSRACRTLQQHGRIELGHLLERRAQPLHGRRRADQAVQVEHLALQGASAAQLLQNRHDQLFAQLVFEDVGVGARAHGVADFHHCARRGHDDRNRRRVLVKLTHQHQAVAVFRITVIEPEID